MKLVFLKNPNSKGAERSRQAVPSAAALFQSEIETGLRKVDLLNPTNVLRVCRRLAEDKDFLSCSGGNPKLVSELDVRLTPLQQRGVQVDHDKIRRVFEDGVSVAVPARPGTIALFQYLRQFEHYNLDINSYYAHSQELVTHLSTSVRPDFVALGIGVAAHLLANPRFFGYEPVMFLPSSSHRALAPLANGNMRDSKMEHYYLNHEAPLYFNQLISEGRVNPSRISVSFADPDTISGSLRSGEADLRVFLWFPYYHFAQSSGWAKMLPMSDGSLFAHTLSDIKGDATVLLAQKALIDDGRAFQMDLALRAAWFAPLENQEVAGRLAGQMAEDAVFTQLLARAGTTFVRKPIVDEIGDPGTATRLPLQKHRVGGERYEVGGSSIPPEHDF